VKKIAAVVLALALLMLLTSIAPLLATVSCSLPYTETIGNLGGADFLVRIPEPVTNWNGGIVIYCRGYLPSLPSITKVLSANDPTSST
jgi:hypothetical protein